MPSFNDTTLALSQITDEGLFEKLATEVMRLANPKLYESFKQTGINTKGKTIKSPVDCITFVPGACPAHMVSAHHTITARDQLKDKWLSDPSQAKPRGRRKSLPQEGDVIKTMHIVKEERQKDPELQVTLALTTNQEPAEDLVRDIHAAEIRFQISIDIWSVSRIAHYLDNNPKGQWLRKLYLGIDQQLLSKELLGKLSMDSINANAPLLKKSELIKRELDNKIRDESPRPLAFIVGESGYGKTVACYKQLQTHIDSGGFGLVISHTTLENNITLEMAIDVELRKLHPSLAPNISQDVQVFCSPESPFLIIVEDISQAKDPQSLLERLLKWSKVQSEQKKPFNWRLLCPLQPQTVRLINRLDIQKPINKLSTLATLFTIDEAMSALECSAANKGITFSPFDADRVSKILGCDPLLIALYDFSDEFSPEQVVGNFIRNQIISLAETSNTDVTEDYLFALNELALKMLENRKMEPTYSELKEWFAGKDSDFELIKKLARNRNIIRFIEAGSEGVMVFRHGRIRIWILADVISNSMNLNQTEDVILAEPFFADVIGTALTKHNPFTSILDKVKSLNPLALFYAIKIFSDQKKLPPQNILDAVNDWLLDKKTHTPSNDSLRWEILYLLSETESDVVKDIISKFQIHGEQQSTYAFRALALNGDLNYVFALCLQNELGINDPWHEHLIIHIKAYFGANIRHHLNQFLCKTSLPKNVRIGALRLAGHLSDPLLTDAIATCWQDDSERMNHLSTYLWAAARCSNTNPHKSLGPICDAWATLPDEELENGAPSERNSIASDRISWEFKKQLPVSALHYFIKQAEREELRWPITYMLRGVDHPDAVEFFVREAASYSPNGHIFYIFMQQWNDYRQEMSSMSRKRLQELWQNMDNNQYLRKRAFAFWAITITPEDIKILKDVADPGPLEVSIFCEMVKRGDNDAVDILVGKLKNEPTRDYWFVLGKYLKSEKLYIVLQEHFKYRKSVAPLIWNEGYENDSITSNLLMRLEAKAAEELLVEHWDHLKFSPYFIQTALYTATDKLYVFINEAITQYPPTDRDKIFKNISWRFGVREVGHPGVTRIGQLEALVPYIKDINPHDIYQFWILCNDKAWFEFRRKHFDPCLQEPSPIPNFSRPNIPKVFEELDMTAKSGNIWVDLWVKKYRDQDETLDNIFDVLMQWLRERQTILALSLVTKAIIYAGKRIHLKLLYTQNIHPSDMVEAIIADATFAVSRRSLV